jgi:transposase
VVGMEATGGAHYWARQLNALGHEVRLMSPALVMPYRKGNKTDRNDADAILEAVSRPSMRFVMVKSVAQQDLLALHKVRAQLVKNRTALCNQLRGLLPRHERTRDLQNLAIAFGGYQANPCATAGEDRIGRYGRAVQHVRHLVRVDLRTLADLCDPIEHGDRRIARCGRHLCGKGGAIVLIDQQEVGKSAPYINTKPVRHP